MVKAEVISEISKRTGIGKADVRLTVETLLQIIKSSVSRRETVHFRGFGNFTTKKRAQKIARNISQNTALIIEEHYIPSFKPSKAFLNRIKTNTKDST